MSVGTSKHVDSNNLLQKKPSQNTLFMKAPYLLDNKDKPVGIFFAFFPDYSAPKVLLFNLNLHLLALISKLQVLCLKIIVTNATYIKNGMYIMQHNKSTLRR